ncbi:hypothetical protein NSTCB13_06694 [Nostoc sp. DSM 114160]|jgi:hypothetical protein
MNKSFEKSKKLVEVFAIASEIIFNPLESLSIAQSDAAVLHISSISTAELNLPD